MIVSSRLLAMFSTLLLLSALTLPAFAQDAPPASSGLLVMAPYLQAVTPSSVYVMVETTTKDPVTVTYGPNTNYGRKAETESVAETETTPATYVHRVRLDGLNPGGTFHYSVTVGETKTPDAAFSTAVLPGRDFRFAFLADFRTGTAIHDAIAGLVLAAQPRFSLYGGDLCYNNSYKAFKGEFFRPAELSLIASVPFFNAPGNHEGWSKNTQAFTWAPKSDSGTQEYYSFDYGDIHFVSINNQVDYGKDSPQYKWLAKDLAATRKRWRIVFSHNPAYCAGGHGEDPGMVAISKNILVPNHVDMVLSGHTHFYQHNLVDGIHHFVVGSVGAPLYNTESKPYTIKTAKTYCYALFDLDAKANTLTYNAYNEKGEPIETLRLTKRMVLKGKVTDKAGKGIYNAVVAADAPGVDPVVTNAKGEYSIDFPLWGKYAVYCDAPGYSGSFARIQFPGPQTIARSWTLSPAKEAGVYNGSFEKRAATGGADGWEMYQVKPPSSRDIYGKPWPDKKDMYSFSLGKSANATPGGALSAVLKTNKPLAGGLIDSIEQPHWAGTWNNGYTGKATSVTDTVMTDTAAKNKPDIWTDGTFILQIVKGELPQGKVGRFRVVGNTPTTITVRPDSGMAAKGFGEGDATAIVHELGRYWYSGGIKTAANRRIPVDRNHVYNLYFKQKSTDSYESRAGDWQHRYGIVWRNAKGQEILRNEWKWLPAADTLTQSVPKMFLAPPAGAATAELFIYTMPLDFSNKAWSDETIIDDVVLDPVPVTPAAKALTKPDGTQILLAGDVVTLAPRNFDGERSTDYLYVSEPDGTSGIRVANANGVRDSFRLNEAVAAAGIVKTDPATREKYVEADFRGTSTPTGGVPAARVTAKVAASPASVGKVVAVTGKVVSVAEDKSSFTMTSEGKTLPVRVVGYPLPDDFSAGAIRVTGVVSKGATGNVILLQNYTTQTVPPAKNDITFFGTTDMHYTDARPRGQRARIDALNALPGTAYPEKVGGKVAEPRGVVFTGDLTNGGGEIEWSQFTLDFGVNGEGRLRFPVYELTGNHDGSNSQVGYGYPQEGIRWRNQFRKGIVAKSDSGLNYSWDWDGLHMVAMNEDATPFVTDSLPFLKKDLETRVGKSGRPVTVMMHYGVANKDWFSTIWWTPEERQAFYNVVKDYNVIAILHGHTYNSGWFDSYENHATWGGMDVFFIDGPLWVFHVTPKELVVNKMSGEGTWLDTFRKPITGLK